MKLIITLALSLLGYASFAQNWQLGLETGLATNYPDKGLPQYYYTNEGEKPHSGQAHLNAGICTRWQTSSHFAFEFQASAYQDHYASAFTQYPSPLVNQTSGITGPTTTVSYNGKLDCTILTFKLSTLYCLNSIRAIKKDIGYKHYLGIAYTLGDNVETYNVKIHNITYGTYGEYSSKHIMACNTLGFHYLVTYTRSRHVTYSLDLSFEKATAAIFHYSKETLPALFYPGSANSYYFNMPTYYVHILAGIAYKF